MARRVEVVIDSSLAVKWFSEEIKSGEALKLMDSHVQGSIVLWVSCILYYEVVNVLRYKPDYDLKKLSEATNHLLKLHLHTASRELDLLVRAGEIAYDGDVSIYDSIPVALAEFKKITCVTVDETQYRKLKPRGYPIELL